MAKSNMLGDIPNNRFMSQVVTNAAVASGGANAKIAAIGPFPFDIRVRSAWWTPVGGDQAATATSSYRRIAFYNGGVDGVATAAASIVASLNLVASVPSWRPAAMAIPAAAPTVSAGQTIYLQQSTVDGTDAGGTVLVAGQAHLAYEIV
jgi:hypothetical protein